MSLSKLFVVNWFKWFRVQRVRAHSRAWIAEDGALVLIVGKVQTDRHNMSLIHSLAACCNRLDRRGFSRESDLYTRRS